MEQPQTQLKLIGSHTLGPMQGPLRKALQTRGIANITPRAADFGRVVETLMHFGSEDPSTMALVWPDIDDICPSLRLSLSGDSARPASQAIMDELSFFLTQLRQVAEAGRAVFVAPFQTLPTADSHSLASWSTAQGTAYWTARGNVALADLAAEVTTLTLLPDAGWLAHPSAAQTPALWYSAKIRHGNGAYLAAAKTLADTIWLQRGGAKKLIVTDLDNTMWGGILGDDGKDGLVLGAPNPLGEAFQDYQRALKRLSAQGVLLAISSKNDETIALDAIDTHPEMILRRDDFVDWRIDWHDKAANIQAMTKALNLGLQSVVFLDDNPAERGRVAEALPEVTVPEWPTSAFDYPAALAALTLFDTGIATSEDAARTSMYKVEAQRARERSDLPDESAWLASLGLKITAFPFAPDNRARLVQLVNKTNQMNMSPRRIGMDEMDSWLQAPNTARELWGFSVEDRYGASGIVAALGLEHRDGQTHIIDFLVSCRVFGRGVEQSMLSLANTRRQDIGTKTVSGTYKETPKNKPFLEKFAGFAEAGLIEISADSFTVSPSTALTAPDYVAFSFKTLDPVL